MRSSTSLAILSLISASAVSATGIIDAVEVAVKLAVSLVSFQRHQAGRN
jgi:hypothetical protein